MSKIFPKYKQTEFQIVTPESVQENFLNVAGEVNGKLDSANAPMNALDYDNFAIPEADTAATANKTTTEWVGQTQKYKEVRRWNWEHGPTPTWNEQLMTIDLTSDDWNKGWNDLRGYSGWTSFELEMDTWEGFLVGQANISFHHGWNTITYTDEDDNSFSVTAGVDWITQWGVFINGSLVAESGALTTLGKTLVIPFGIGVGTGTVTITIGWRATTTRDLSHAYGSTTPDDPTTPLEMFGATIWARNTRR